MKYYSLKELSSRRGLFQADVRRPYGFERPESSTKMSSRAYAAVAPDLESIVVADDAEMTDVLSLANMTGQGLLVSGRARAVLDRHRLMPHQWFPATVLPPGGWQGGARATAYHWLHLVSFTSHIDYPNSKFHFDRTSERKGEEVSLATEEEYLSNKEKFSIKALLIKPTVEMSGLDLVTFLGFAPHIFASERLVGALKTEGITGLEYHGTDILMS
ncbi:MAG: hypothetical protein MUC97_16195 [Bernardetiaceae bacterium]|jgi:hypothetical protein|nr:hypothetical protein [Bernardetiaceae bacterium]